MSSSAAPDWGGSGIREIGKSSPSPVVDKKNKNPHRKKDPNAGARKNEKEDPGPSRGKVDLEA